MCDCCQWTRHQRKDYESWAKCLGFILHASSSRNVALHTPLTFASLLRNYPFFSALTRTWGQYGPEGPQSSTKCVPWWHFGHRKPVVPPAPELEFLKLTVWSADMQKLDIQSRRMIISPVATQVQFARYVLWAWNSARKKRPLRIIRHVKNCVKWFYVWPLAMRQLSHQPPSWTFGGNHYIRNLGGHALQAPGWNGRAKLHRFGGMQTLACLESIVVPRVVQDFVMNVFQCEGNVSKVLC